MLIEWVLALRWVSRGIFVRYFHYWIISCLLITYKNCHRCRSRSDHSGVPHNFTVLGTSL